jgi:hypothetical protein
MPKYQAVVQFAVSKLYYVDAEDIEEASDRAYELALDEPNSHTFDSIDVIDFL